MKKDLPYFTHDNDARNHPKMLALRAKYGWAGYGQFWALNEMIAGTNSARLDLGRKVIRSATACELGMGPEELDSFLKFLSDDDECGLIDYTDGVITTERTTENYAYLASDRERKKEYASSRRLKQESIQILKESITEQVCKVKESKVKESKVNESKVNESNVNTQEFARGEIPPMQTARYPQGMDWRLVLSTWHHVNGAPSPGDLYRFQSRHGRDILPLLDGLQGDDYIAAIRNYATVKSSETTWWVANPDILTWTRKHLDRFLPVNFHPEEYQMNTENFIDWDKYINPPEETLA